MKAERGRGEKRVTEHMLCDSRGRNLGDEGTSKSEEGHG